jgi:WD40 repeat protein
MRPVSIPISGTPGALAFSPDGKWFAVAYPSGPVRVWNAGKLIQVLDMEAGPHTEDIAWSRGGKRIAVSDRRTVTVRLWQSEDLRSYACDHLSRDLTSDEALRYLGVPKAVTCPSRQ